jgi:hypothetical protein
MKVIFFISQNVDAKRPLPNHLAARAQGRQHARPWLDEQEPTDANANERDANAGKMDVGARTVAVTRPALLCQSVCTILVLSKSCWQAPIRRHRARCTLTSSYLEVMQLATTTYSIPKGRIGRRFCKYLTLLWQGVRHRKGNPNVR